MEKMKMESVDGVQKNIEKLAQLFPNCVTEKLDLKESTPGHPVYKKAINVKMLEQMLSDQVLVNDEAYEMTWVGKRSAMVEAHTPIRKTLRPYPNESINWDTTENLYIEGDNLDVLKLLRNSYDGQVKMIYIDPPYNTGKNSIYKNDYSLSLANYEEKGKFIDNNGNRLVLNSFGSGRFHSDWLTMIYSRLLIARQLLSKEGVIVVAIDEHEFATLAILLKEIFLEPSYEHAYVSVVHNPRGQQGNNFSYVNEYLIFIYPVLENQKILANFLKDKVDSRQLRDSGSESLREDGGKDTFYPFIVKDLKIIGIGEPALESFHPQAANIPHSDGTIEIWPIDENGIERKWRHGRYKVQEELSQFTAKERLPKLEVKQGRSNLQIYLNQDEETIKSVWKHPKYDSSEYGTKLLDKLIGGANFTFPKSLYAVEDCIKAVTQNDPNAIIMDFFSGSATTAHAVMKLNSEDRGSRKFIMVQSPENLDETLKNTKDPKVKKQIQKAISFLDEKNRPHLLSEIGKERIKAARNSDKKYELIDSGFRVFKIDSSNMEDVYFNPRDYNQKLLFDLQSNVKKGRSDLDLFFGCILELGYPLSSPYSTEKIGHFTIHNYNDGDLIACFDEKVSEEVIREIASRRPRRAVFRDSSFGNSPEKINVFEIFKKYMPEDADDITHRVKVV